MAANIAINGFGRIGRLFFRQAFEDPGVTIAAINDLGDIENLAYVLQYDTVYRKYKYNVRVDKERGVIIVEAPTPFGRRSPDHSDARLESRPERREGVGIKEIKVLQEKDPLKLPWGALGIDIVVESTGVFEEFTKAKAHLDAGAKRVVLSAPAKDEDGAIGKTVLIGINEEGLKKVKISSNASCTTNAASPVMEILREKPGIKKAVLNTVHSYTATQTLTDSPTKGSDFRRGRAAAQNIAPSTTGAALAVARAIPELEGKFDGIAMRVPSATGSIADITFVSKKKTSVEEVNDILKKAAAMPRWQGIVKVTEDQVVSSDIIGEPYGAIVDLTFTKVIDGDLVKVLSWYDNEWGYAATLLRHVKQAVQV